MAVLNKKILAISARAHPRKSKQNTAFGRPQENDPNPKHTIKSTTLDVEELADQMELGSKFYVMGYSMEGRQFGAPSSTSLI
ncbi:hypothetical protein GIB67_023330, partial [Kingdonia uniflora]